MPCSVLAQTLGDLELIVIDDASRDGTWDAIQSIRDPRLRAFRHKDNQGAHVTLNEGLGLASGDFLAILNSDDAFHPERLNAWWAPRQHSAPGLQRRGLHRQPWPARPRP
jgi:glycosyltransferase involved in cell wall biosynthesis